MMTLFQCILLSLCIIIAGGLLYDPKECRKSREGAEYMGTISSTTGGIECQRWDSQVPHQHNYTDPRKFPDRDFNNSANYCRNPDLSREPWCLTTDPEIRRRTCEVPICEDVYPDCLISTSGLYYAGTKDVSQSGKACHYWNDITEEQYEIIGGYDTQLLSNNFCRNPDSKDGGPWCFVGQRMEDWEYCAISLCKPSPTCTTTLAGAEYIGKRGMTVSGRPCQRWDRQTPHQHSFTEDAMFPDSNVTEAENFCRNPEGLRNSLWCYTTDVAQEWEYCDISQCSGCKATVDGRGYMGTESSTATGLTCINWAETALTDANLFPDESIEGAVNYCRNPDSKEGGVWCHTGPEEIQWEYCDVPLCEENCDRDRKERRTARHILHVGVDGLHSSCWINATEGVPNFLRMSAEGSFTYSKARGEIFTFSAPNWGSFISGLGIEETGITSNDWEAPWNGYEENITPITGLNYPMPNVLYYLKGLDANTRTAAFYTWPWFYELLGRGSPGAADVDFHCRDVSPTALCDWTVVDNVTDYMQNIVLTAERSYTFVQIDHLDGSGHSNGWCTEEYLETVNTIDEMIGTMLNGIEGQDVVFALSSDHGGTSGHGNMEDEHLLIPIWFLGPGIKSNYEITKEVRSRDMVPTLLWSMGIQGSPYIVGDVIYEIFE